jgi:hypothetical protein
MRTFWVIFGLALITIAGAIYGDALPTSSLISPAALIPPPSLSGMQQSPIIVDGRMAPVRASQFGLETFGNLDFLIVMCMTAACLKNHESGGIFAGCFTDRNLLCAQRNPLERAGRAVL